MAARLRQQTATGTYTALASLRAHSVALLNKSGSTLEIRYASDTSNNIDLADGLTVEIPVVSNSNEIEIKGSGEIQLVIKGP